VSDLRPIEGGVCAARGFLAAGVRAGIKDSGTPDLALIFSEFPAAAAGVFSTNKAVSPTVTVTSERVAGGSARGVVVNSGCANACTGERGMRDAREMAELAAQAVGVGPEQMLVCSTGLIGSYLPMDKLRAGIPAVAAALKADDEPVSRAIMTTDTRPKLAAIAHSDGWRIGGIAKGAGMIAPNLATMLAYVTTDAVVDPALLRTALVAAADQSFNCITVDGDNSTNDTLLAFANGACGVTPEAEDFAKALSSVCTSLARQIVADGEGATKLVTVKVRGAASLGEARLAARTVADSLLVKTAVYGGDANWGRVVAAVGRSGAQVDMRAMSVSICGIELFGRDRPAPPEKVAQARVAMRQPEVTIECALAAGEAEAQILTTDLTPEYVTFNAEYET
jgi:glutamate N-acetyltransferase / amino-acid N-acetyltransferase